MRYKEGVIVDVDETAVVDTGSANPTAAGCGGNVEAHVELRGPRAAGIDAMLADTPGEVGLDDLLVDYQPLPAAVADTAADQLAGRVDEFRHAVAACTFHASVVAHGGDYQLTLRADQPLPPLDADDVTVAVWPITLTEDQSAQPLMPGTTPDAAFGVTLEGITAFFGVRVSACVGTARLTSRFMVTAALTGAPDDRHSRLLAAMLRDPDRLLRYLLLLLADPDPLGGDLGDGGAGRWLARWTGAGWDDLPLLELLVRAADRHPDRLDHIDRLLADLGVQRERILPEHWDAVWKPIWTYREQART
jgi:hypothetical protein